MPRLADLQAAVPKCTRMRYVGLAAAHRCGRPMHYAAAANIWKCPKCGTMVKGLMIAGWGAVDEAVAMAEAA